MTTAGLCSWEALGTSAVLALTDRSLLARGRGVVEEELDLIDRTCSRFRSDSDLSRVNAHAGEAVTVDVVLLDALDVALRAARATDGDVDPTLGVALEDVGYDRDWKLIEAQSGIGAQNAPTPPDLASSSGLTPHARQTPSARAPHLHEPQARAPHLHEPRTRAPHLHAVRRPRWQAIEVDRQRGTVKVPRGVKLDLGATAKAWAADRASRAVHGRTGAGALVSLGGDISVSGPAPRGGWQVHVTDDHRAAPTAPGQRVFIGEGGLATSSVVVRRWRHHGAQMHHLIDPSTGAPAQGPWRTVSVAAIDCADANIASTAALVRGDRAADWLASLGLPSRLVSHEGEVLTIGGWPAETERLAA